MTDFSFRLYVAGRTVRSRAAEANLRLLCSARLDRHTIEIIDVTERPDRAEEARILATPTVVRLAPQPCLRVVGDLSDHDRAAAVLGLPGVVLEGRPP
jgi:circadian clock protein KaiB